MSFANFAASLASVALFVATASAQVPAGYTGDYANIV